jgi:peptide/nickel transport system ATP-binding protein
VRGSELAMIFQEPATSLNPVLSVGEQIVEVLERHASMRGDGRAPARLELVARRRHSRPRTSPGRIPFQLSGGMKQRVMIAMALAGDPALLIADEPTTALDVTIQAQVLELLGQMQRSRGMGMLLITHDLGIVAQLAHRVGVMYAGELVEELRACCDFFAVAEASLLAEAVCRAARCPSGAAAHAGNHSRQRAAAEPAMFAGCRFAERCPSARARCGTRRHRPGVMHGRGTAMPCAAICSTRRRLTRREAPALRELPRQVTDEAPPPQAGTSLLEVSKI